MDTYSWLRELADSWVLLAMVIFYLTACIWPFSPWRRQANAEAAAIIMNDDAPRADLDPDPDPKQASPTVQSGCDKNCAACRCATLKLEADHV
ncbi:MAG: cbb3-type cytochrome c oxidase subunit 3 [Pseudomonadota bacterium]